MNKVIVIAEAGVNHNGSIELAKELIDIAVEAKADYVKFQTYKTENLVSASAELADYQKENLKDSKPTGQFEMLKKLELSYDEFRELKKYCDTKGIGFLSTAFDNESIDFIDSLSPDYIKIPSGEITNYPYLKKIGSLGRNVILSTGMSTLQEVEEAMNALLASGLSKEKICVLHCTSDYPAKIEQVNLLAMKTIQEKLNVTIGYSDHTLGEDVTLAAVAIGATVIEKHFTIDKNMPGPDHKASLNGEELKNMISSIRVIEKCMGSPEKKPSVEELQTAKVARKSIHLRNNLEKGSIIKESDLIMKRPGTGISPMKLNEVIGKIINKNLGKDHVLELNDLS